MKKTAISLLLFIVSSVLAFSSEKWPDGERIDSWFRKIPAVSAESLGPVFSLSDAGIKPDGEIHTVEIQALIDSVSLNGGGVIAVPSGTFLSGALDFPKGTHLRLDEGAVLKGSDFIGDYPLRKTRIEGQTCMYYPALVNADGNDGFTVFGKGTLDGSGEKFYRQFWLRRKWNPQCTNKDEQRPRLLYVSNSRDVRVDGITLKNSPYWTSHFHNCCNLLIIGCSFYSPCHPGEVKGPSTDAIDLDAVRNVHIKDCHICVNDDAIALKGGKGPYADAFIQPYPGIGMPAESVGNGSNENVLIEDCEFEFCHGCLTLGSESVINRNILMRNISITGNALNLLWLKCRPDTPQTYEYVTVEDVKGKVVNFFHLQRWTQFYDLQGRESMPPSQVRHVSMKRCEIDCKTFFNASECDEMYKLSDFFFENLDITAENREFSHGFISNFKVRNLKLQ